MVDPYRDSAPQLSVRTKSLFDRAYGFQALRNLADLFCWAIKGYDWEKFECTDVYGVQYIVSMESSFLRY